MSNSKFRKALSLSISSALCAAAALCGTAAQAESAATGLQLASAESAMDQNMTTIELEVGTITVPTTRIGGGLEGIWPTVFYISLNKRDVEVLRTQGSGVLKDALKRAGIPGLDGYVDMLLSMAVGYHCPNHNYLRVTSAPKLYCTNTTPAVDIPLS